MTSTSPTPQRRPTATLCDPLRRVRLDKTFFLARPTLNRKECWKFSFGRSLCFPLHNPSIHPPPTTSRLPLLVANPRRRPRLCISSLSLYTRSSQGRQAAAERPSNRSSLLSILPPTPARGQHQDDEDQPSPAGRRRPCRPRRTPGSPAIPAFCGWLRPLAPFPDCCRAPSHRLPAPLLLERVRRS